MEKSNPEVDEKEVYFCMDCNAEVSLKDTKCPKCGADVSEIQEDVTDQDEPQVVTDTDLDKKRIYGSRRQSSRDELQEVIVTDIQMPFLSMVSFMIKWIIASIPAIIVLVILFAIVSTVFGGLFLGLLR
ncbi:MAG TPA: hypothetical protein PKI17_00880 [Syntrophomonas sp.]|nr:hypothetical protein [Syntrophomonas sp.]